MVSGGHGSNSESPKGPYWKRHQAKSRTANFPISEQKTLAKEEDAANAKAMEDLLLSRFRGTQGTEKEVGEEFAEGSVAIHELLRFSRHCSLTTDELLYAKLLFDTHSYLEDKLRFLNFDQFVQAVVRLQQKINGYSASFELVQGLCRKTWDDAAGVRGRMDCLDFLFWYSLYGFSEELLLDETARQLRRLGKTYRLGSEHLDTIKRAYDTFDTDGSGLVDFEEFRQILGKVFQIPAHLELPTNRVRFFWHQIDVDCSGKVNFEEFLQWWMKNCDNNRAAGDQAVQARPFEDFYKSIRSVRRPDPPAYKVRTRTIPTLD